jgi:hypothetical protein
MIPAKRLAAAPIIGLSALLTLTACDAGGGSSAPGAVSEGEAEALDDAADMLDERQLPDGALPPIDGGPIDGAPIDAPI